MTLKSNPYPVPGYHVDAGRPKYRYRTIFTCAPHAPPVDGKGRLGGDERGMIFPERGVFPTILPKNTRYIPRSYTYFCQY